MAGFFPTLTARPILFAATVAALRAQPSATYVAGQQAFVSALGWQLRWDPASFAADNATTIIRPTDIIPANPGRFLIISVAVPPMQATFFVDGSAPGPGVGTISNPFVTIQAAILAVVPLTPTQILVAPGAYVETLTVPGDLSIVLQPLSQEGGVYAPLVGLVGNVNWNPTGALIGSLLVIRGFSITGDVLIDNVPAAVGSLQLELSGVVVSGSITDAPGAPYTGLLVLDTVQGTTCTAMGSSVRSSRCAFSSAVNVGAMIDQDSVFVTFLTLNSAGVAGVLNGTAVSGSLVVPTGEAWLDDMAARLCALSGSLPTPVSGVVNRWRGGAGYYGMQHTVRQEVANFAANLGDEYLAVLPPVAGTVTVTLPAAALFAASAGETNGAILRRPTRHILVRNEGASLATAGIVAFAVLGTDLIDTLPASNMVLLPGEGVRLIPVLFGAVWSWQPEARFGRNYGSIASAALSATAGAVYVTKASLVTPPLGGVYRVVWRCIASVSNANTDVQTRLRNVTDAADIGSINRSDPDSIAERIYHGGGGLVTFTGLSKTFTLDFQAPAGVANAQVEDAWIEIWRVG